MVNDISRIGETVLSIIGGVSGLIMGMIFIGFFFDSFYYFMGPDYFYLMFGALSLSGGVIGVVCGVIFKYHVKIASILAIIASVLCLAGGIVIFGVVGFVLLLVAGILGFVKK